MRKIIGIGAGAILLAAVVWAIAQMPPTRSTACDKVTNENIGKCPMVKIPKSAYRQ